MTHNKDTWRFYLADSSNMELIGRLRNASNKSLTVLLNRPGSCSFSIPLTDPLAEEIYNLSRCIVAVKGGVWYWSGPVWTLNPQAESNTLQVSAVGWLEEFYHRIIRGAWNLDTEVGGGAVATQEEIFNGIGDVQIARALVAKANAQVDGRNVLRSTHISLEASSPVGATRTQDYKRGQNIGQEIQKLSDLEFGFDFDVTAGQSGAVIMRFFRNTVVGTIIGKGEDRSDEVNLAFGWGPRNLSQMGYQEDSGRMMNRMVARYRFGQARAEDRASMDATGFMFEEEAQLNDVTNPDVALAYAGAEVVVRSLPFRVYSLTPFPLTGEVEGRVPEPLVDYGPGDIISLTGKQGALQVLKQPTRIFGMTISIDANDVERVDSLQTAPSG